MNTALTISSILSLCISVILMYKISRIIGSKGYSTSIGTNPSEIFDFIKMIRKETDKREKRDYIIMLIAYFFFVILTIVLFFSSFLISLKVG